jgi:hypothetical protein
LLIASALCMIEQGNQADSATTQFQSFHTLLVSVLMSALVSRFSTLALGVRAHWLSPAHNNDYYCKVCVALRKHSGNAQIGVIYLLRPSVPADNGNVGEALEKRRAREDSLLERVTTVTIGSLRRDEAPWRRQTTSCADSQKIPLPQFGGSKKEG